MNIYRLSGAALSIFALCLCTACSAAKPIDDLAAPDATAAPAPDGDFAVVNGEGLPKTALDQAVQSSKQPDTPALRATLAQRLIAAAVVRQAAQSDNYDRHADVEEAVRAARGNAEIQAYLRDHATPPNVSDTQVRDAYDRWLATRGPNDYQGRIITVKGNKALQTVESALKNGADFATLASQYSLAPSRADGGALPWVNLRTPVQTGQSGGLPLTVAQALTTLHAGKMLEHPLEIDGMWVFVRLDAQRPAETPTFAALAPSIQQQLQAQARMQAENALISQLVQHANIAQ